MTTYPSTNQLSPLAVRKMSTNNHFAVSDVPISISYIITFNLTSNSLATIESELTNQDILVDLKSLIKNITSVGLPTFIDVTPSRAIVMKPSLSPSMGPSLSGSPASPNLVILHIFQVRLRS